MTSRARETGSRKSGMAIERRDAASPRCRAPGSPARGARCRCRGWRAPSRFSSVVVRRSAERTTSAGKAFAGLERHADCTRSSSTSIAFDRCVEPQDDAAAPLSRLLQCCIDRAHAALRQGQCGLLPLNLRRDAMVEAKQRIGRARAGMVAEHGVEGEQARAGGRRSVLLRARRDVDEHQAHEFAQVGHGPCGGEQARCAQGPRHLRHDRGARRGGVMSLKGASSAALPSRS